MDPQPEPAVAPVRAGDAPLSRAVFLLLGLCVAALLLVAAVLATESTATPSEVEPALAEASGAATLDEPAPRETVPSPETPDTEQSAGAQIPQLYPSEPRPVPQELITDIEAASGSPLPVELGRLLGAIQEGFGSESVQLAPELRPYAFRMASRFDWNPDTFRVAVTAPSADLAEARASTLRRLFESATGSERLQIRSGTGPHALTLVSDS